MKDQHTPAPWDDTLAPLIRAGDSRVQCGGQPTPRDCRVLAEENFQFAKRRVNAYDEMLALLRECLDNCKTEERLPISLSANIARLLASLDNQAQTT